MVEADLWEWEFDLPGTSYKEYFQAYTQDCADCVNGVTLVLWEVYFDQKVTRWLRRLANDLYDTLS